jgi:hypothetical protein
MAVILLMLKFMIRKLLMLFLFWVLPLGVGFSQVNYKNGLFLELGGNGYYGSINYERTNLRGVNGRIGIFCLNPKDLIILPLTVGKVFGVGKHHLEIAGGFIFALNAGEMNANIESTQKFIYLTAFVGYRYQVIDKRFFFRAGFTPLWELYDNFYNGGPGPFYPWGGISGGFRF